MRMLYAARLLTLFESVQAITRYVTRTAHEPDFRYFRHFPRRGGLFLDVGANIGQSILSLSIFRSDLRIIAFEPNPALEKRLRLIRWLVGKRLTIRMTGASDQTTTCAAYLPRVRGVPFLQELTLDRSALGSPETQARFRRVVGRDFPERFSIDEIQMQFESLDVLLLEPDVIKIDVQGCEALALAGMRATIRRCRPLLVIEADLLGEVQKCTQFLQEFGYRSFVYDPVKDTLLPWDGSTVGINLFFDIDRPSTAGSS